MKNKYFEVAVVRKSILLLLGLFLLWVDTTAQNFYQTIYLPPGNVEKEVAESAKDLAYWLEKASGKKFEVREHTQSGGKGIHLQRLEESSLSSEQKKELSKDYQSFYLIVNGSESASIVATSTNSFINGMYTFLHELGFRWYMPGDNWTIVPELKKEGLKINKVYAPDFQNRSYFGTGGVNAIAGVDPKNTFKADFDVWNRRNRFSTDFDTKGHRGQVFYRDNKAVLDLHPEYSCGGKVNKYGRIDVSNSAGVMLFVNWALSQANPKETFPSVGVDPADGSGGRDDCLPSGMPEIKNYSDKYFWLANKVAEESEKKKQDLFVQLYAYDSHAKPPRFKLHERVYPIIIPYAFQRETSPTDFIRLWADKMSGKPMGIYDYWNITQWSKDVPQFNIYSIPQKLRLWRQYNINTVKLESTNAKGPMGHAFWLAGQMLWDVDQSFESLYIEFLTKCFGPASEDIRRMYDRWSTNYQGAMDVGLSLNDLAQASAKAKDIAIQKRLSELKAYVHYLRLYYDYENKRTQEGYEALNNYLNTIHSLRLVQTSALKTLYITTPDGKRPEKKKLSQIAAAKLETSSLDKVIENNFKKDILEHPANYKISKVSFDIKKASPKEISVKAKGPKHLNGRNDYLFYLPRARKVIFEVGSTKDTRFVLKDATGKTWLENMIRASKENYETLEANLPPGTYSLSFGDLYRFSRINFPSDLVFFTSRKYYDNSGYPLLYVYIPKDVSEIIYRDEHGPGTNKRGFWIDPDGKKVTPSFLKYNVYKVEVPPQLRGKVWTLSISHRSFQLLNVPEIYSLTPFDYSG